MHAAKTDNSRSVGNRDAKHRRSAEASPFFVSVTGGNYNTANYQQIRPALCPPGPAVGALFSVLALAALVMFLLGVRPTL
jgi:hypothetical protein